MRKRVTAVLGIIAIAGLLGFLQLHSKDAAASEPWVQMLTTDGGAGSVVTRALSGGQWYTLFCRGSVNPRYVTCEREPCLSPKSDGGLGQVVFLGSHHDVYLEGGYARVAIASEDGGGQSICEVKQLILPAP